MKIALTAFLFISVLRAQIIVGPESYTFPKTEPLAAALATSFLGTPNGTWTHIKLPLSGRTVRNFRDDERVDVRYLWPAPEKDRKELVYLLAGFGGKANGGKQNFLARKLADGGFHVLILPSIFTRDFVVGASSHGVVGEFSRDAWDYFRLMKAATKAIQARAPKFKKRHMVGYSYGALTAAFVARIDKNEKYLRLEKEVLVNPPTNLLEAAALLDGYAANREAIGGWAFTKLLASVAARAWFYRRYTPDAKLFARWLASTPLSARQKMALVGHGLRSPLPKVANASADALLNDHGSLMGIQPWKPGPMTFAHYLKNVILKYNQANTRPNDTLEKLNKRNSLYALEKYFRRNDNVYLVHNQDDFLLRKGDKEFFAAAFGDRFVLYPWGGHMGNMWHPQNIRGLLSLLKGSPAW